MKLHLLKGLSALLLTTVAAFDASAAAGFANCSIKNIGSATAVYSSLTVGKTSRQVNFDVYCERLLDTGGQTTTTVNYAVAANNGIGQAATPSSTQNKAKLGAGILTYDLYTSAACNTLWPGIPSVATSLNSGFDFTNTYSVFMCIDAGLSVADGTYADTVNLTLTGSTSGSGSGSVQFTPAGSAVYPIAVNIITPPTCNLASTLNNVDFGTYTAFGGQLAQTVNMNATCSDTFPYTMSIAASNNYGVLAGLNYSLSFSNTSITNTVNVIGNGLLQGTPLYAKMAAGQAGTCSTSTPCSATSAPITLTITY